MTEYIPINWTLMKHPMNWVIIVLMVYIALIALNFLFKASPYTSEQ